MRSRTSTSRPRPRLRQPSAPSSRAPFLSPSTGAGPRDHDHTTLATPPTSPCTRNRVGVYHDVRLPPNPTPLVLTLAWRARHDTRPPLTTSCACNRVGVYHDTWLLPIPYTPRACNHMGGTRRCSVATPLARSRVGVPQRSVTTPHTHNCMGVYIMIHDALPVHCLSHFYGVPLLCRHCCSLVVFEKIIYGP
jgi:hypothetical protein